MHHELAEAFDLLEVAVLEGERHELREVWVRVIDDEVLHFRELHNEALVAEGHLVAQQRHGFEGGEKLDPDQLVQLVDAEGDELGVLIFGAD